MSTDFYIKLTLAVYRVTELFPEREALKRDIRDLANEILVGLIDNNHENVSRDIEKIKSLFELVEAKNWVDSRNFSVLRREYDKITGKTVEKPRKTQNRKETILNVLKDKKKIQLKELIQSFPRVSKRTLMRDLEKLYRTGIVIRVGSGRSSCYNLKQ